MFHKKTSFLFPFLLEAIVWVQLADITTHAVSTLIDIEYLVFCALSRVLCAPFLANDS